MYVQPIQKNTNFMGKTLFLPADLRNGMLHLKNKMEAETIILSTKASIQTISVRGLEIKDKFIFKNGRFLAKRNKQNKLVPYGNNTSMIEFNNVKLITKDDGEIIEKKKPLFKSWTKIFEQASEYIQFALNNYNDEKAVSKIMQKKDSLTPHGKEQIKQEFNKIMDIFNKINPWSV